jgi:glycosyltransferase involved in cell wall biosynthesis
MLLHKSVEFDSRVRREAKALSAAGHDVTVLHLAPTPVAQAVAREGYAVASAEPPRPLRRLPAGLRRLAFMAKFVAGVRRLRPDVVHAHDAAMLAPGLVGARLTRARLVYDSHELATGVPYRKRLWAWFVGALERAVIRRCDGVITVSDGIADRLEQLHGLDERPLVVRNLPDLPGPEGKGRLRKRLGVGDVPLVLHQGAPARDRGCEQLVQAMVRVQDAHLVFLGDGGDRGYGAHLAGLAEECGVRKRVHFVPSVPLHELLSYTSEADVGVSLLEGTCENHRLALPNKVFEYVAAGIPVVASDLPELGRLVEDHGIGWTVDPDELTELASVLQSAVERRAGSELRARLDRARTTLTWADESRRLLDLYAAGPAREALVFVRNAVTYDARVHREARLLARLGFRPTVVGVVSSEERARSDRIGDVQIMRLAPSSPLNWIRRRLSLVRAAGPSAGSKPIGGPPPGAAHRLQRLLVTLDYYRRGVALVCRRRPALVHCNDYNTMWIGVAAKLLAGSAVVYDAHELWPDRNLRPEWRAWLLLCEWLFVRMADSVVTTSPGYAKLMARRYRIEPPLLVRNVPEDPPPPPPAARNGVRRAVYFGAITRHRGLETAISALSEMHDLELRLVGPQAWGFRAELEEQARREGVADRVELLEPVAPTEAWDALADAAVGLALIEPGCLSYRLTLPNKLFEYAAAGLPVVASDVPVIAEHLARTGAGLTADPSDVRSVRAALRSALDRDQNARLREDALRAAAELTWASESKKLEHVYQAAVPRAA